MLLRPGSRPARVWPAAIRPVRRPAASHPVPPPRAACPAQPAAAGFLWAVPVRSGVRLAVDVGSARIGVARSDPGGILASPLTAVPAGPRAQDELVRLAVDAEAIEVVVGLPTSLSGREGTAAAGARSFAADLADRLAPIPVRLLDERFTTTEAHGALRRGDQSHVRIPGRLATGRPRPRRPRAGGGRGNPSRPAAVRRAPQWW